MNKQSNIQDKIEKMQQHLTNISEMLNSRVYNLLLEFTDMRNEIRELQIDLHEIIKEDKK